MITYQITSMVIGICIAAMILWLVRRDHLHGPYAIWWMGAAVTVGGLGFFPQLFDYLAVYAGIRYPPILAIVLALGLLILKILTMDLERSRQERLIRRLAQRLAMLEAGELSRLPETAEPDPGQRSENLSESLPDSARTP